jgi:hypothetical protein
LTCACAADRGAQNHGTSRMWGLEFSTLPCVCPRVTAPAPRSSCPLHQESFLTQARSLLTLEIIARAPRHHQYAKPTPALALQVDGVELPGTLVPSGLPLVVPTMQRADKTHSTNESSGTLGTRQVHRHTHTRCAEHMKSEGRQSHTWTPFVRTFVSLLPKVKQPGMSAMTSS